MRGQLGDEDPSGTAQTWQSVRRVREPVAWVLLVLIAFEVLISAWKLAGLPGSGAGSPVPGPMAFQVRAVIVAPDFVAGGIVSLPLIAVTWSHSRRVRRRVLVWWCRPLCASRCSL